MINDLSFNQDSSCVSVATSCGYSIYNCDPFGEFYSSSRASGPRASLAGNLRHPHEPRANQHGDQIQAHGHPSSGNGPANNSTNLQAPDSSLSSPSSPSSPTALVRLLFTTSLTIIIPQLGQPNGDRLMRIFNLKQGLKICELTFPVGIVAVRLNRKRLCVFLQSGQLFIYDLGCVRLVKVLELAASPHFVGDLAPHDCLYLVIPMAAVTEQTDLFNAEGERETQAPPKTTSLADLITFAGKNHSDKLLRPEVTLHDIHKDSPGWLVVYDTLELRPRLIFKAHDSPVARVTVSNDGARIATALSKGTIVRVSHLATHNGGLALHQVTNLRRGHQPTKISTLAFSPDGGVLGCGSKSGTVHLFAVGNPLGSDAGAGTAEGSGEGHHDSESEGSSSDLNDNLSSLLIAKPDADAKQDEDNLYSHLKSIGASSKLINNHYTKTLMKKLPYKHYLENLIWEPPRRSFAFVKLAEHGSDGARMEIGIAELVVYLASYQTGKLYQYQIPANLDGHNRVECQKINEYQLAREGE